MATTTPHTMSGLVREIKSRNIANYMASFWSFVGSEIHYAGVFMGSTYVQACDTFQKLRRLIANGDLETQYKTLHACEMICTSELSATHGPALDMALRCNDLANDIVLARHFRHQERLYSRRTVFVGKIHPDAREDDIRAVFESCGRVEDLQLIYHTRKDVLKGHREYAFVRFDTDSAARRAVLMYDGKRNLPIVKRHYALVVDFNYM